MSKNTGSSETHYAYVPVSCPRRSDPLVAILLRSSAAAPDVVPNFAKIVTHPPSAFDCRAAAIRDDRTLLVWPTLDLLPLVRPATAVNDLGGSTVLPGRIDTHTRTLGAAIFEFDHPPPRMEIIDDILSPFRRRGGSRCRRWRDPNATGLHRKASRASDPTRTEFDGAAPRHAVYCHTRRDR